MTSPSFDPFASSRGRASSRSADSARAAGGGGYDWRSSSSGDGNRTGGGDWATTPSPSRPPGVAEGVRGLIKAGQQRFQNNSAAGFVPNPSAATGSNAGIIRQYTAGRKGRSAALFLQNAPALFRATTLDAAYAAIISDPASQQVFVDAARRYYAGNSQYIDSWATGEFAQRIFAAAEANGMNPGEIAAMIASGELPVGAEFMSPGGGGSGFWSGGGGGYGGGSSTQMTIDLSSPQQARGLIMQTIQGVLGRDPSDDEYNQFVTVLNEAQTANPQVVTASGDTVTRSGGIDAGLLALDYAQSRDDYEDVQANQYYNMFLDVLAGG